MEVKRRTAKTLVNRLSSDSEPTRSAAIAELRLLSKWDSSNRRTIAEAGTIPRLIPLLFSNNPTSKDIASNSTELPSINPTKQQLADQENAITCLLNLSILPENRSEIISARGFPSALLHILRWGRSAPAIQNAAATVYSLLVDESLRPILGGWTDTVSALIDILRRHTEDDPRTTKDSLKALFAIALYPLNRPRMVEMGAVPALLSILIAGGSTGVVEDASAVAAQVSGCEEAAEAFEKANGLRVLVDLMEGASSPRMRENAAAALLSLARSGGDRVARQIKELETTQAAIDKLMKSDSQKARSKAEALQSILDMQHETLTKDSWVKPVSEVDEEDDQFV